MNPPVEYTEIELRTEEAVVGIRPSRLSLITDLTPYGRISSMLEAKGSDVACDVASNILESGLLFSNVWETDNQAIKIKPNL